MSTIPDMPTAGGALGPSGPTSDPIERPLRALVVLRRRLWLVALMSVATTISGAFYTSTEPKIYRATSTVFINDRAPLRLDKFTEAMSRDYGASAEKFVNAQVAFMTSRQLAERTAERLGFPRSSLIGKLSASIDRATQIAGLSVEDFRNLL